MIHDLTERQRRNAESLHSCSCHGSEREYYLDACNTARDFYDELKWTGLCGLEIITVSQKVLERGEEHFAEGSSACMEVPDIDDDFKGVVDYIIDLEYHSEGPNRLVRQEFRDLAEELAAA